jgi:uncharacterized Fe-S cluster-containing radical SAM superfamily protein
MNTINTDEISERYRAKAINVDTKSLSITNYRNSIQEQDLTEPANCDGFGRIRHFKYKVTGSNWPVNPLPIIPVSKKMNLKITEELSAQVFQNSICNWRCWYCYVDFKLLSGNPNYSSFLTCENLLELYLAQENPPILIDLSGGQPDLTPEWVPWMMQAIMDRKLEDKIFLWSDDNLSNDYFWKYLTNEQISLIQNYKNYARVCCFKGVDETSFSINTKAEGKLFNRQIELFKKLDGLNIDLYAYITLTGPSILSYENLIPLFLDRIQEINESFPLRIVPLKITEFSPGKDRNDVDQKDLLKGQMIAIEVWQKEIEKRFPESRRSIDINEV